MFRSIGQLTAGLSAVCTVNVAKAALRCWDAVIPEMKAKIVF